MATEAGEAERLGAVDEGSDDESAAELTAVAPPAAAPVTVAAPVEPPVMPRPAPTARPIVVPQPQTALRAEPYVLPIDALSEVASQAGLQWVHSDADKVRQAQEAIAAAPKPAHVPREPKPPVALDDGPLILVETKKDLSQIRLPFDSPAP